MVDRVPSRRESRPKSKRGGRRPGAGRRLGSVNEAKKVARAVAAREDKLPHELLLEWARTGKMVYVRRGKPERVELEPSDRISCAKGSAAWYKPPYQARVAPGEQPQVYKLELDEKALAALVRSSPDQADMLRAVLKMIDKGGAELAQLAQTEKKADPDRYGRMLSESSDVAGRA